jgi:3',5'-cyclic AMP phosphodiesterase CpdA
MPRVTDASPAGADHGARILHLSDLPLTAVGIDEDGVDAAAALRRLLFDCRHLDDLDLVIVSGDIADDGTAAAYELALAEIGAFAAARAIPHVYCTGNHDAREAFAETLGSGHLDPRGKDIGQPADLPGRCCAVSTHRGIRVITLDTLIAGEVAGEIGHVQLAWLTQTLAHPADGATVVVLHHPPLDVRPALGTEIALRDRDALLSALRGHDVTALLCGHLHLRHRPRRHRRRPRRTRTALKVALAAHPTRVVLRLSPFAQPERERQRADRTAQPTHP